MGLLDWLLRRNKKKVEEAKDLKAAVSEFEEFESICGKDTATIAKEEPDFIHEFLYYYRMN